MYNLTNLSSVLINHTDWCQENKEGGEGGNHMGAFVIEGILVPIVGTVGIVGGKNFYKISCKGFS